MIKLMMVAAVAFAVSGCEQGSYFDRSTAQLHSDKVGRVEATGEDFRVYEFTPQTAPNMQCVFAAATRKGGLVCFPKAGK